MKQALHPQSAPQEPLQAPHQRVRALTETDRAAVQQLLQHYPLESVFLQGLLDDHGLCSPKLRGQFFGWFKNNELAAVALLGHQILFCGDPAAFPSFAQTAVESKAKGFVVFGPKAEVDRLGQLLSSCGRATQTVKDFCWYVCEKAARSTAQWQLQQASLEHLEVILALQAQLHLEATGVDPRLADPDGFRERVAARIERGRTWIKMEAGQLVFKAELQSVTPTAVYLEGIWTNPDFRGLNIAKECVLELTARRLHQQQTICLAVEPEETAARHIYESAGFRQQGEYQALYLQPLGEPSPC